MIIYWGVLAVNAVIQTTGNGITILLIGLYALAAFLVLGVSAVTPIVALSNPISMVLFVLFFITVIGPVMVDAAGFFLFATFIVLSTALTFDSVYMLVAHPDTAFETLDDLF
mmetsp:Transcript_18744/g.28776  ORF Transcript_18744/g.28776 Transcript_18744/m.28776 type:complete len:112 (+) Transcript_18744:273-608(+)